MKACDGCLRRAHLIGLLAPRIADLLDRPSRRAPGLLALPEADLLAGVAGREQGDVEAALRRFDVAGARERLAVRGLHAACRHGSGYPPSLSDLPDAPAVLFSTSPAPLGDGEPGPVVAIVGTRAASPYGLEVAHSLGRGLAAAGVTVVSGLALGVDAAAHRGCLDGGGRTVAVLACGVDVPYPRRHRRLYERIVERGAVVSELPPGQRPFRWSFPACNRIMAALAEMVVLVEAADPSGTLITAEFARDLGRAVGAVPGRITSRMAEGTNGLLRDGAIPVTSVSDVLDELFGAGVRPPSQAGGTAGARLPGAASGVESLHGDLRRVLDAVEAGAAAGEIAHTTELSAAEVRASLARLEAMGLVARSGLGSFERTADLR